jgi:GT2 family glycosyltransferase
VVDKVKVPRVSIIVLNYANDEQTIRCVRALLMQKYPQFDIVIVDNGSPGDSYHLLKETFYGHKKVFVIKTEKNMGYAKGNNYGVNWRMSQDQVDYILILNNDVYIEDRMLLDKLVKYAESVEDLGVVGPKVILPNEYIQGPYGRPNIIVFILQYLFPPFWLLLRYIRQFKIRMIRRPARVYRTIGACMLIKVAPFVSVGGFDESTFMQGEEDILAERLRKVGYYYYYYPMATVLHNHTASSTLKHGLDKDMFKANIESMSYYFKEYRNMPGWLIEIYKISAYIYMKLFYNARPRGWPT